MRKGWEYKKLGEVLETTSGGTPSKSHKEYYEGGTIPWLRSGEVSKGDIYDAELYITEEGLKKSSAKLFPIDTVLIAMYGATVGQVGILKSTMCTNQAICGILPNKDFHPNFLKYVLLANKKNYLKQAIGGAQPNISQQVIKSTYIPIVKFSEQESVVSELDKINELIRLKKEQLKDFDNLAQSLFYEMFGDPVENEKGWKVKKLGDICADITDGDHMPPPKSEFGIPFITISDIDKDTRCLNFENTFYVPEDYYNNLKENRKPQKGDLLYTVTGSYGIPVIVKTDKKFCFQRHIALLRPNKEILSTIFLCYWVLSDGVKFMADKVATGIAQKTVGLNSIRKFSCILPPLSLQRLFAQRIEQIEREKSEVQKSIQNLETLLASRMQYWFE